MANYEREFSHFPDQKIVLHNFVNVDDSTIDLINKIDELRNNKKFAEAQNFIEQNADKLKQCIADAVTFRTWEEEIYNTQVYAKQVQQCVYFGEDKPDCLENDVWITGGDNGVV